MIKHSMISAVWAAVLTGFVSLSAYAGPDAMEKSDMKALLKGKDAFSVTPPPKWSANTDDASAKGMYAYFIMNGYSYADSPGLIYIRLMEKKGLSVSEHLKIDMDGYRGKGNVKFERFNFKGIKYAHAEKKYVFAKASCDYVCFVDPGKDAESYLVFVLSAEYKRCDAYKHDFEALLKSFVWNSKNEIQ